MADLNSKASALRKGRPVIPKVLPSVKSGATMEVVYGLWDELDQFPADASDQALAHLAQSLRILLRADNVKWIGAVRVLPGSLAKRDILKGWRLQGSYDLVPDPEEYRKLLQCMFQKNPPGPDFQIGLATHAIIANMGTFQVHRMRDGWIPFREFSRSEHYQVHYTSLGITARMWISFPLNANAESIFLLDRWGAQPHFSKHNATLAGTILRGIRGFHRRLFLDRGLFIGEKPLSPTFRRIVQKLLTGLSEKEIALSMNQGPTTTHKYVKTIYERFGVHGRAELMALWLGKS